MEQGIEVELTLSQMSAAAHDVCENQTVVMINQSQRLYKVSPGVSCPSQLGLDYLALNLVAVSTITSAAGDIHCTVYSGTK